MAKGMNKLKAREEKLLALGKTLTRRAKSQCELCPTKGSKLITYEVPPIQDEPDAEHCLLLCETCYNQLHLKPSQSLDDHHWRCLHQSAWSEVPAAQVMSVRLLRQLEESDWAKDLLEQLYLPEDIQAWIDAT